MSKKMYIKPIYTDDDTGEEIIIFKRLGKWYIYLRDSATKLFIKMLRWMDIRVMLRMEYPVKRHPIYIDAIGRTAIRQTYLNENLDKFVTRSDIVEFVNEVINDLCNEVESFILEKFNKDIADMLKIDGIAFGSESYEAFYPDCYIEVLYSYDKKRIKRIWIYRVLP